MCLHLDRKMWRCSFLYDVCQHYSGSYVNTHTTHVHMFVFCPITLSALGKTQINPNDDLDGGVPGRRVESIVKPAHLTDGVVVTHQSVLPPAVRDGVEIAVERRQLSMNTFGPKLTLLVSSTYTLLSHEEHTTVLPSASIRQDERAWGEQQDMRTEGRRRNENWKTNKKNWECKVGRPCWRRTCFSGTPWVLWRTFSASSLKWKKNFCVTYDWVNLKWNVLHFAAASNVHRNRWSGNCHTIVENSLSCGKVEVWGGLKKCTCSLWQKK